MLLLLCGCLLSAALCTALAVLRDCQSPSEPLPCPALEVCLTARPSLFIVAVASTVQPLCLRKHLFSGGGERAHAEIA